MTDRDSAHRRVPGQTAGRPGTTCSLSPFGWRCLKHAVHGGRCIETPRWWNLPARLLLRDAHRR